MVETGAAPKVSCARRQVSRLGRALTTPLLPDDYFALINPRWSTRELTGTVVRVRRETDDAATIVIKPDFDWPAHTVRASTCASAWRSTASGTGARTRSRPTRTTPRASSASR